MSKTRKSLKYRASIILLLCWSCGGWQLQQTNVDQHSSDLSKNNAEWERLGRGDWRPRRHVAHSNQTKTMLWRDNQRNQQAFTSRQMLQTVAFTVFYQQKQRKTLCSTHFSMMMYLHSNHKNKLCYMSYSTLIKIYSECDARTTIRFLSMFSKWQRLLL